MLASRLFMNFIITQIKNSWVIIRCILTMYTGSVNFFYHIGLIIQLITQQRLSTGVPMCAHTRTYTLHTHTRAFRRWNIDKTACIGLKISY